MKCKIVTVTLNPAIDKTIFLQTLCSGVLNRVQGVVQDVGGKGINVSKTLGALQGTSFATGILPEQGSHVVLDSLTGAGIAHDFVPIKGSVRTNTKIVEENGCVTELNETGPVVEKEAVAALETKLRDYASEEVLFVFAGSVGPGAADDIYERLIHTVHAKGAKALLDADGALLFHGLKAVPEAVKPNLAELLDYYDRAKAAGDIEQEIGLENEEAMGRGLLDRGIETVMISCGAKGAAFLRREKGRELSKRYSAIPVRVCSTVGAGDAMTAAYCYAVQQNLGFEEMARLCMAVSAGAVTTQGTKPPEAALIHTLLRELAVKDKRS